LARKFIDGAPVYASRQFDVPESFGRAILSDFGSAVRGDEKQKHNTQPNVYRSPEVMLKADWSYPVDICSAGVMVCLFALITKLLMLLSPSLIASHYDLLGKFNADLGSFFKDGHLFYGNDPGWEGVYHARAFGRDDRNPRTTPFGFNQPGNEKSLFFY
jgi:hypothetical protein